MTFQRVAALEDLWIGELLGVDVDGRPVLLVRLDDGVRAFEDRCAHLGVRLSRGTLEGAVLRCSAHHWEYDARTGRGLNPRTAVLRAFPVRVEAGAVWVSCPPPGAARGAGGGVP